VDRPTEPTSEPAPPSTPTATISQPAPAPSPAPAPVAVEPDVPAGADAARDAELKKQAEGIVSAFVNFAPAFTPDKKKVVFLSDRDGLPQLYVADVAKPDAQPLRLTTTSERIVDPRLTPDGKAVVFRSDKGANERWSILS
jgi:tricorn protease-like protein